MFDKTNTYASFDLIELGLLQENWVSQIKEVAECFSYFVKLDGKSSTSREPADTEGAEVFVVEGDTIATIVYRMASGLREPEVRKVGKRFQKLSELEVA